MPTGYTACVQDGSVDDLRTFALQCARAFGALGHMRDMRSDAPIPAIIAADTEWADEQLMEANKDYAQLTAMTTLQADEAAKEAYETDVADWMARSREKALHRQRYETMYAKVEAWQPADRVEPLRKFMLDQLQSSIDFDCSSNESMPSRLDGAAWLKQRLASLAWDINYYTNQRAKQIASAAESNLWLDSLRISLA